jgi:hypothetical protein
MKFSDRPRWTMGLMPSTAEILVNAGYTSKEQVIAATDRDLMFLPGLGRGRLEEIDFWSHRIGRQQQERIDAAIDLLKTYGYKVRPPNAK